MQTKDLHHKELVEHDSATGTIRFAGQRALLVDAVAMGLLRRYLWQNSGVVAARAVLTQFGFAQGWRMADAVRTQCKWFDELEWQVAGARLQMLEGLFLVEPGSDDPTSAKGARLLRSYEAEQHLLHFGRAEAPMCWTICGLLSGYLSRARSEDIIVCEDACLSMGHEACHFVGRTRAAWGVGRADELQFFDQDRLSDCLDIPVGAVISSLRDAALKSGQRRPQNHLELLPSVEPSLGIVAESPAMAKVVAMAHRVAAVASTVLITGESGSGKERIARLIHEASPRASEPFVAVNCGAITDSLLESELFGHVRGAFTGAGGDRAGLFEVANSGTLLLDEIGDVSPNLQTKLLRVLQEREIRRVGQSTTRPIDVRVIAATNKDLAAAVGCGDFRQDLYYRLHVVELLVPPLRQRKEDILPLARALLADTASRLGRGITQFSPRVADQLLRYRWPGNVRELENAMERAVALARGARVELEDLPEEVRMARSVPFVVDSAVLPLAEVEKEYVLAALAFNGGNRAQTARQLKIGSATLYRKLKLWGTPNGTCAAELETGGGPPAG